MPRTVADATRFTATGPHAFSQSHASSPAETPQQRVARLRDAARRAKEHRVAGTMFERILDRGRAVADKAHRVVAVGLIGGTVLAGAVTVYAMTDMMIFNRRRRAELGLAKGTPVPAATPAAPPVEHHQPPTEKAEAAAAEAAASIGPVVGPWTKFKSWALSGMTPADQEYKTAFERQRDEERKQAEAVVAPIVVELTREGRDAGERIDRLGADDLVKGEKPAGGSVGVLSSVTGWWSGR
ncbi:hypothetical protein BZA05DRAFT_117395 [Tricharina praecox]|uniref:uncharacterized protein n=1 Tax=Tricharina praecox TaxID=43433 RepID=UPI00221E7382|nr:uncharacterized protein BZA05DRAFT_117395 [Tricharina praecox]KAI5847991.1 hypothetical protein BZA05DRAFT_117395 [Tricharina praecox]